MSHETGRRLLSARPQRVKLLSPAAHTAFRLTDMRNRQAYSYNQPPKKTVDKKRPSKEAKARAKEDAQKERLHSYASTQHSFAKHEKKHGKGSSFY